MGIIKKCTKCGRELSLDNFYNSQTGKYSVYSVCKKCMSEIHKKYYSKNLEKMQEMTRIYNKRRWEREKEAKKQAEMMSTLKVSEILGGYRIYVLNHTKEGEFKYTAVKVHTADVFRTNDKREFLCYLEREI